MPDTETTEVKSTEAESTPKPAKKGLPLKTILVVLGLLLAEGGVVIGFVMFSGSPDTVQGGELELTPIDELESVSELMIVRDKFPNHHTGRVWLWDIEAQVQVKQKHRERVEKVLQDRGAEIKTGISQIIRTAHQNHLQEPNLETLTRQLTQYLRDVFGTDADGEPRILRVLLPNCVGFPADF